MQTLLQVYFYQIVLNFLGTNGADSDCFRTVKVFVLFEPVDTQFLLAEVAADILGLFGFRFFASKF